PLILLTNRTNLEVDLESLLLQDYSVEDEAYDEPLVLVIHTHGTEAYISNDREYYYADEDFRSDNTDMNIVSVGDEFCRVLAKCGIISIHDRTMHDKASYSKAYRSSGSAVTAYLDKYPSIKYVIDIHRDAVCYDDVFKKPVVVIENIQAAQVMIVVGTDQNGAEHPNWQQNLIVALKWQELMNESYPLLARPVMLHKSSFNQFNMPTMLLLEIGAAANTLQEALLSADLCAQTLAELIKSH
ncbi:MAG TPA: stage II sporulation protein P, partial [Bacillota bacterium]|nr:stage II sporulation protein P [Bacillota bacterium]